MKNLKKVFLRIICVLLILFCMQTPLLAAPKGITAPAYVLIDANSGLVLEGKNENSKMFPASTTKIMTAILAIENGNPDDIVKVTASDVNSIDFDSSRIWLSEFEEISVRDLILSLLISSANDSANVLARHISGSYQKFADLMNERARELGATHTHFVNPHGLHDKNHYTTPYDLAIIAKHAMTLPMFRETVATVQKTIPATNKYDKRVLKSTNFLLYKDSKLNYEYATGIKTGYTEQAKNCLVSSATTDKGSLIAVVMGCDNSKKFNSFLDSRSLLKYGFDNCESVCAASEGEEIDTLNVRGFHATRSIPMIAKQNVNIILPENTDSSLIEKKIYIVKSVTAPLPKNSTLGRVEYLYKGTKVGETLLVSDKDYKKAGVIENILNFLTSKTFLFILIALFIIWMLIVRARRKRRRLKRRRRYIKK